MAVRAVLEAKNGQKLPFLVLFREIFTEYGHATHQNDCLDESFHMEAFWGLRKSNREEKFSRKSIRKEKYSRKSIRKKTLPGNWFISHDNKSPM